MTGMLILCSRNAQDKNVLVRRAQWDQARVPFPGRRRKRAWGKREGADWMCFCAHATRGRGRMRRELPGALLARETRISEDRLAVC